VEVAHEVDRAAQRTDVLIAEQGARPRHRERLDQRDRRHQSERQRGPEVAV